MNVSTGVRTVVIVMDNVEVGKVQERLFKQAVDKFRYRMWFQGVSIRSLLRLCTNMKRKLAEFEEVVEIQSCLGLKSKLALFVK